MNPILQLRGISKYFPGVKALEQVDFDLRAGEVHALCGENGAGKSTLMNILTGNLQPDAGQMLLDGSAVAISGPAEASRLGIAIVYQQLSVINTLSVAENIFANRQPRSKLGFIRYGELYAQTQALLDKLRLTNIRPQSLVGELSPGQRQMVEIAKALAQDPRILILDEPTASITQQESDTLFALIRQLKADGKAIIYISHRLKELFTIADRVTVLKDGRYQTTRPIADVTSNDLIRLMVGRDVEFARTPASGTGEPLLEVKNLTGSRFERISFTLHRGEILGLAGLVGAGRTEVARAIFGIDPLIEGRVMVHNKPCIIRHPADAVAAGIGYVPEERKTQGIFLNMSVMENVLAADLPAAQTGRWYGIGKARQIAERFREQLRMATPSVMQRAGLLSGGNQQKAVLARWLLANPDVLIVDEPTHGIDVGAKSEIHTLLSGLAAQGKGILLISSELPELLALADRILVIRQGTLAGELAGDTATEEAIMALAAHA
ncbi:sugar ABC transporter ATP-binding protein [Nibrella saemangeumensis]|uniref:Sugar ABC transporter ATP-binding protein n=1 Tax=Nibrella saemangeumensis TaxID=1084526 RepID=A0ABP8MC57_9BACT